MLLWNLLEALIDGFRLPRASHALGRVGVGRVRLPRSIAALLAIAAVSFLVTIVHPHGATLSAPEEPASSPVGATPAHAK